MRLLSRTIFRENFSNASLGVVLFTSVLFLPLAKSLFEYLVRSTGPPRTVAYLFALVLPQALPFAIPLGVLVGTLLTLSRMSADGEITAMRAAGVPGRTAAPPILVVGFLAMLVTAAASLWLTPWSIGERFRIANQLAASELTADVQERLFAEQFPDHVLYVGSVSNPGGGQVSRWTRVFMADITPPENRKPGEGDRGDSPLVTLAPTALALADVPNNRIQISLVGADTYELGKDNDYNTSSDVSTLQALQAQRPAEKSPSRTTSELPTFPLYRLAYRSHGEDPAKVLEARVELQQRLAFPLACLLLTLTGIPLGITSKRGGKSSAVVLTFAIFFVYYIGMLSLSKMARQGTLPAEIAVWIPNVFFMLLGLAMMARLEFPGDRDYLGRLMALFRRTGQRQPRGTGRLKQRSWTLRIPVLVQIIDTYILTGFLFYFGLLLMSFVLMYQFFQFFTLLSDMIKNNIPMSHMLSYHFFLTPRLIYEFAPVAVLAAVLVVFGVMAKNNEVTAFKACGISVYRLAAPVLVGGLLLSGSLFAFDQNWLPAADRRQDQLYNEIKNKAPQTYQRPDHKWVYGLHDRVYYYKYFLPAENTMLGVNVYEIDPVHFRLTRHIFAEKARWEPNLNKWVFENGWSRDFKGDRVGAFDPFAGSTRTFNELEEKPDYFMKEKTQPLQMNFYELQAEIADLKQSGFPTTPLEVELQKKFSTPLFALILAVVSVPFAFRGGNRGAMAGVGISIGIYVVYYGLDHLFEQVGDLSQLSPAMAAWSPDLIFSLVGLYFMARMRT
ncbi:MAG TPA: LptF/LptG family permease [Bryobacteraceae bacterium]|jgi:LPS export ABC transporter permease LptG/LPS export ABC transporter permease LptF